MKPAGWFEDQSGLTLFSSTRVVRLDAEFPRDDDDKASSIAVAGLRVERLAVFRDEFFPVGEKTGSGPAAVVQLQGKQFRERLFALLESSDAIDPD